jgi:hypothetical protein
MPALGKTERPPMRCVTVINCAPDDNPLPSVAPMETEASGPLDPEPVHYYRIEPADYEAMRRSTMIRTECFRVLIAN